MDGDSSGVRLQCWVQLAEWLLTVCTAQSSLSTVSQQTPRPLHTTLRVSDDFRCTNTKPEPKLSLLLVEIVGSPNTY